MNSDTETPKRERLWLVLFFGFPLALTAVVVYFLWAFAADQDQMVARVFGNIPNPPITSWVYSYRVGFLLLPLPWICFALYAGFRGSASTRQLLTFSSTLLFTLVAVSMLSVLAFSLPWFPPQFARSSWVLNTEQLAQALYAAERNDAQANYLLFRHYVYATRQRDLAERYLAKAAELGHERAKEDLERRRSAGEPVR